MKCNLYQVAHYIWKEKSSLPYTLDGLVFTPIYEQYFNSRIFKWKPKNTIDFYIEKQELVSTHETWKLHISGLGEDGQFKHFDFNGFDSKGNFQARYNGKVLIKKNDMLASGLTGIINVKKRFAQHFDDKSVIEFQYSKNTFVPIGIRKDKEFANNILAVNDAWDAIENPITESLLKRGSMKTCIRKFHNDIKREAIFKHCKQKVVLDIGSGAGGDIMKYVQCNAKQVVGIDIVKNVYDHPTNMSFHKVSGLYNIRDELNKNPPFLGVPEKFDVVICNFAAHYFFENDDVLQNFINNIKENLKSGGKLILTIMEGEKIQSLFEKTQQSKKMKSMKSLTGKYNDTNVYKIKLDFDKSRLQRLVGNKMSVNISGTKYFKSDISEEYLVYSKLLHEYFLAHNIRLVKNTSFEDLAESHKQAVSILNPVEKEFSFLNTLALFQFH